MSDSQDAVEAVHRAICEYDLDECLEWRGKCVKAVEAAAPYMLAAAWDEGVNARRDYRGELLARNPYRRQA